MRIERSLRKYNPEQIADLCKRGLAYVDRANGVDYVLPTIKGGVSASADLETGVNGASLSTGDVGSATAFSAVAIGGSGSLPVYDTAHVAFGSLAAKFTGHATSEYSYFELPFTTVTDQYTRFYMYVTGGPSSGNNFIAQFKTSGGANAGAILWHASGALIPFNGDGTTNTATGAIPNNQLVRIECHTQHGGTGGLIEVKLFLTASSSTPDSTASSTSSNGADVDAFRAGINPDASARPLDTGVLFWIDQVVAGVTSGYPGPYVPPSPAVSGALPGARAFRDTRLRR
jgi:hypothetical protein